MPSLLPIARAFHPPPGVRVTDGRARERAGPAVAIISAPEVARGAPPVGGWGRSDVERPVRSYAEAAYRRASGVTDAAPADGGDVEVTLRRLADGSRVAVARRTLGGRTAGIEAVVGA